MSTPQSEEQVKSNECDERQEEMDAIAGFGNRGEFPDVSGAFSQTTPPGAGVDEPAARSEAPKEH